MSAEKSQAMRRVRRAAEKSRQAAAARNAEIHNALEVASLREVAVAAGLSPARIHQIRHGR